MSDPAAVFRPKQARPAPAGTLGAVGWIRQNLLSSPGNALLTVVGAYLAYLLVSSVLDWAVFNAVWEAESRRECLDLVGRSGACWPGVFVWFDNLIYGLYPKDQVWRINAGFAILIAWVVPLWLERVRSKVAIGFTAVLVYPFLASYFFLGGDKGVIWSALIALGLVTFVWVWATTLVERTTSETLVALVLRRAGQAEPDRPHQRRVLLYSGAAAWLVAYAVVWLWELPEVGTNYWGGLFLTLVISGIGITFSLPAGILLALGRRCDMPVIQVFCTAFIELFRSVPLITILFMFTTMLPLFLPIGVEVDLLVRAIVAVCLFASAYMAEIVRGGLQAIPRGQYEAAAAMGFGYWQVTSLIIMPQALKVMIPTIVGQFISLFKDTTLVSIIGLFDLLNMARAVGEDTDWLGLFIEPFFAVTLLYFVFCFAMSQYSINLERKLDTGHRS